MKFINLLLLILAPPNLLAIELQCVFKVSRWIPEYPPFYECEETVSTIITREDSNITAIHGTHAEGKSADDVTSIYLYRSKPIHFFPQNLDKIFKYLQIISIVVQNLREIRKKDLRNFPKLKVLYLDSNDIKTLEKNLFAANRKLEFVNFSNNLISHVDLTVFKGLNALKALWFENNDCYSRKVNFNRPETLLLVREIRESCYVDQLLDVGATEIAGFRKLIEEMRNENLRLKNEILELKVGSLREELGRKKAEENLEKCENEKKILKSELQKNQKELSNLTRMAIERMKAEL